MLFSQKLFLGALACIGTLSATSPMPIYTDSLASGWSDASYATINYCASPLANGFQQGSCAISASYPAAWSGWAVKNAGVNPVGNGYNALSFLVHGISSPSPDAYVTLFGVNNVRLGSVLLDAYIPGKVIGPGWQRIEIPLADMGLPQYSSTLVTTIDVESSISTTLYFDDMKFDAVAVPDQSVAYRDNPAQNPGVNFTFGWHDASYGTGPGMCSFGYALAHLNGTTGIVCGYPTAWTGFSLTNSFGIDTHGKNTVSIAVSGGSTGGQDLYVVLASASNPRLGVQPILNYVPGHNLVPNQWYEVNIPLADLGGSNTVINRISIESASAATVYYDDISVRYVDPYTFYDDGVGPRWRGENYGSTGQYVAPIGGRTPASDVWGLRVDYSTAWGGVYISDYSSGGGVNTAGKSFVVLSVNGGTSGAEDIYLSLYGANTSQTIGTVRLVNYLVNPLTSQPYPPGTALQPNTWYDVIVPLSALNAANATVTRIGLECDRIASVWFDDIRIGGFLRFPLLGYSPYTAPIASVFDHSMSTGGNCADNVITTYTGEQGWLGYGQSPWSVDNGCGILHGYKQGNGQPFSVNGQYWQSAPTDTVYLFYDGHTGYDYPVPIGTNVYATADGVVNIVPGDQYHTLSIGHANGYETYYLHCSNLIAAQGQFVHQGDLIALSGRQGTLSPHLHVTIKKNGQRVDPYGWAGLPNADPLRVDNADNISLWQR